MSICILLSTYNGEKYIEEQLNSIAKQDINEEITIYVRDDGSTDHTLDIIDVFSDESSLNIQCYQGKHLGPSGSFLELIYNAPEAEYYAFCDQDDVWESDKLSSAIQSLKDQSVPALWVCDFYVTDEDLNIIEAEFLKNKKHEEFHSFFYNDIPGCAMVFNRLLLEEIRKTDIQYFKMHDLLALMVAWVSGKVLIKNSSYLYYRQHSHNAIGIKGRKNFWGCTSETVRIVFSRSSYNYSAFAARVLEIYHERLSDYEKENYSLIRDYRKGLNRIRLLKKPYILNKEGYISRSLIVRILLGKL